MKRRFIVSLTIFTFLVSPGGAPDVLAGQCDPPPFISAGASPMVMLVMGRDHKLYYEAYNDAQDLDEDGKIDVGYKHSIDYYGYFDPYKCYTYTTTGTERFIPERYTADKYCGGTGEWSGNFLNWLSMSRMDVLKRVLYGGQRIADNASETVLEGVYIPQDSHSWGKEYAGADTRWLTPYDQPDAGTWHLFCVTSLEEGEAHKIRVALNDSHDVWDWATTERAVCSGPETPSSYRQGPVGTRGDIEDFFVRVEVCSVDADKGLEQHYCKEYPAGGGVKPIGLLQKYGEGDGSKVCSKTSIPCQTDAGCGPNDGICVERAPLYYGLLTGSNTKNLSGGVLRKNIWSVLDEIDAQSGIFQTSESDRGNIIMTLDRLRPVGFRYSDYSYQDSDGGACGWITDRPLIESECRMWGNPVAEMMYEALRYLSGKGSPTGAFNYNTSDDAGLNLSKPDWGRPYDIFPSCAKPSLIVLSDINPSYDSDKVPGTDFGSFTGDLKDLNVSELVDKIGTHESVAGGSWFIGESGSVYDFICTPKNVANLSSIRGLCPEEPTKQGSYYSAAVAYYGKTKIAEAEGMEDVTTYVVPISSPVPDINIKAGSGFVRIIPIGKSVSGSHGVYDACADRCTITRDDDDDGLHISNCDEDAYCPSNQIVDFYVDEIGYDADGNMTHAKFRINFEDVEQGADHDMDAMVKYDVQGFKNGQVEVSLTSEYAKGSIDQVLGFIISGTTEDGVFLPVKDKDVSEADGDTPEEVSSLKDDDTWNKTFTLSGSPSGVLKDPLWYAAKWGGFDDINGNDVPDLQAEWDKDGDGIPDNFVANPLKLEEKLEEAFLAIPSKGGSAGAVATVIQEVLGEDLVIRGAFTAYEDDTSRYLWKGHLEAYWPYEGCSDYTDQSACEKVAECEWSGDKCIGEIYSFQKDENIGKFCADPGYMGGHCWDAGTHLTPSGRTIFTMINGKQTEFKATESTVVSALENDIDFDGDGTVDGSDAASLIDWMHGVWDDSWTGVARDRQGWLLGDIVYSTPVVVGPPSVGAVDPNIAGDCSCECGIDTDCEKTCFYCYRTVQTDRPKVVYVGGNDGMLHAFTAGVWSEDEGHWIYDPNEAEDVGKERWAYIPGNLLSEVKELARAGYGTPSGCAHRTMVDLSPTAWEVFIDHDGNGSREWRTVIIGGERGGGDVYFAIDVTDPDSPKVLWEYSVLRNLFLPPATGSDEAETPFRNLDVYNYAKTLPVSWSVPYVGHLALPSGLTLAADNRVEPLEPGVPSPSPTPRGVSDLSGWFAFMGSGTRVFNLDDFPEALSDDQKRATLKPYLLAIDIEKGINVFQFLWPQILDRWSDKWPDKTSGSNTIPYAMGDPLVLDIWNEFGVVLSDGSIDHIYLGDLNGNFYGLKFNLESARGLKLDVWRTKDLSDTSNLFRSDRQPVTVMPVAAFDEDRDLRLFFGTGKFENILGSSGDKTDPAPMSFYGLKEDTSRPSDFSGGFTTTTTTTARSLDVKADFHCLTSTFETGCSWLQSDGSPDCCESVCPSGCWNCVYDLLSPGERVVDSALVAGGTVFFTTFVPKNDPCSAGGDAFLYAVDYLCGVPKRDTFEDSGFTEVTMTPDQLDTGEYTAVVAGDKVTAYVLKIGQGMPSRPVMDSSGESLFVSIAGDISRLNVDVPTVETMGWKVK
jgi:type IV pilus assembly protein PilY1